MSGLSIQSVTARPLLAPLTRPITTAVACVPEAPLVLIDVETRQGVIGRSYIFTYTPLALAPVTQMIESIGQTLTGREVEPLALMATLEQTFRLLGRQGLVGMAVAGLDMAFWDAAAKARDLSVAAMLGASEAPLPCYDSHGIFRVGRDEGLVKASIAAGFKALKFKIGGGSLEEDVTTLRAIRDLVGPEICLMVDYNQSLTAPEAARRITRFKDEGLDLAWVEEPVAAEDYAGHVSIRANVRTPIQTGENWWMPDDAARAIAAGIGDHAMLDIMKIGGVTGWQRAAAMAEAASLPVSSHIFIEASAHALAATPNAHLLEHLDVASAVLLEPHTPRNGTLTPRGPGLGIAWDEPAIARLGN